MIYIILDIFFVVFHTALILFNVFGWTWKKTRKANLVVLLLTGASWFLLGIFYGIGYCPLTDWHFQVLEKLGKTGLPTSYTEYLAERITGINFRGELVDTLTMGVFLLALSISIFLNIRDFRNKRK
ncbi:MAG: DUF2784 domain-containing protein [Bacteroidales bacterium]